MLLPVKVNAHITDICRLTTLVSYTQCYVIKKEQRAQKINLPKSIFFVLMNINADLRSYLSVNIVDDFVHVLTTLSHWSVYVINSSGARRVKLTHLQTD